MAKCARACPSVVNALLLGTTAFALFAAPVGMTGAAARVGVTSATDGDPLGKPPTSPERVLRIGIDVQANEVITTNADDRAHLVFLDGSSLTVGPNARLTIDKFVFDPVSKKGDLAINASKGVFRLVGGQISKTSPITINTPTSTMGIRGGITIFSVEPAETISTFVFGISMTVLAAGQTQLVTRPGSQVTTNAGRPPGPPILVNPLELKAQLAKLEGLKSGGSAKVSTFDAGAQDFSKHNSAVGPQSSASSTGGPVSGLVSQRVTNALSNADVERQQGQVTAQQVQGPPPGPPVTKVIVTRGRFVAEPAYTNFNSQTLSVTPIPQNNVPLAPTGTVTTTGATANGSATITLADGTSFIVPWQPGGGTFALSLTHPTYGQLTGTGFVSANGDNFTYTFTDSNNKRLGFAGGTPTTLAQFPTAGFSAHALFNLSAPNSLPFSSEAVGSDPNLKAAANQSPLYSVYAPKSDIAPTVGGPVPGPQAATAMQATISISGQGTAQKSYMGVFIADYFADYNNNTILSSGTYGASYRLGANQQIGRQISAGSTFDTGGGNSIFGPNADAMVYTADGAISSFDSSGGVITSASTTRRPQASFNQPYTDLAGSSYYSVNAAQKTTTPSTLGQSRTTRTMNGFVGGVVEQQDSQGNFSTRSFGVNGAQPADVRIATDAAVNRAAALITVSEWDGASTSATFRLGGLTGGRASTTSFIDDNTYAVRDRPAGILGSTTSVTVDGNTSTGTTVDSRTVLVSYNTAPLSGFFQAAGVAPCACDFLTWGWWGGDVSYNAGSVYNPGGRDRFNFATYVAGTLTNAADLSTLNMMNATATYSGHMIGNVVNGTSSYVAAGSYTNQWSFGPRTGIATINFDGASYGGGLSANTALNGGGPTFSTIAPLPSSGVPGRNLGLNGAFFSSPTVPAKGQAGSFAVTGTAYQAGGTFAAQKP